MEGLLICSGRCRARWLKTATGKLVDVASLPLGVCACCDPRQALAGAAWGAVCPASGKGYLLLANGPQPIESAAPDGLCACCAPPAPLVWDGERLVCSRKRGQVYARKERANPQEPAPDNDGAQAAFVQAVDAALHANSAKLTVFGLFDVT
jgi:hypothetical protein